MQFTRLLAQVEEHAEPEHGESYADLLTSLPHWLFELTVEGVSTVFILLVGQRIMKRVKATLHREIDAEHGFVHTDEA